MSGHHSDCPIPVLGGLPDGVPCFVCPALRACEERLLDTIRRDSWYEDGYAAGLAAARDAVEVALLGTLQSTRDRTLAAIDALRGES